MQTFQKLAALTVAGVACAAAASAQSPSLSPKTAIPVTFTQTLDAGKQAPGTPFRVRTAQAIHLSDGTTVRAGAEITGHVVSATPFVFDKTPYAKQKRSVLTLHFDSLSDGGRQIPLHVVLRAMADTFATWESGYPQPGSDASLVIHTQVGGDQVVPSQDEVRSAEGDVVGYNRRIGIYAHLIAAGGKSPATCDGSDTEQSMGVFSASACGLYGFSGIALESAGDGPEHGTIVLESQHRTASIHAHSAALLEEEAPVVNVSER